MSRWRNAAWATGWSVVLVLAACVTWFGVFPGVDVAAVFVVVTVPPALVAGMLLGRSGRRSRLVAVISGVATAVAVGAVVAVVDGSSPLSMAGDGTVLAWKQILTVPLPVPAEFPFLAGPILLTGLAAVVTVLAEGRTSWVLFAPAWVVWLAGVFLGVGGPVGFLAVSAPLLGVTLVRLAWPHRGRGESWSPWVRAAAVGLPSALVAFALAPALTGIARSEPFDPRSMFQPPVTTDALANPLDQLGAQLISKGGQPALKLRASGPVGTPFVMVTSYGRFDGVAWRMTGGASPVGGAQSPGSAEAVEVIDESVSGSSLTAPWVPHTGEVTAVDTAGLLAFKSAGALLDPRSPARDSYELRVTSVPRDLGARAPRAATSPNDDLLDSSCLPAYFAYGMATASSRAAGVSGRIAASQQWLVKKSGIKFARNAPAGQSCSRLEQLVKAGGDRRATSEQAATILTLGLRAQGIPARLAYGYRLGQPRPDGTYAPLGSDAVAYTQVLLDPFGWISVDAAPAEAPEVAAAQSDLPEIDELTREPLGDQKTDEPGTYAEPGDQSIPLAVFVSVVAAAGLAAATAAWLAYASGKRRRVRRAVRSQVDVRRCVLGAWAEALAGLTRCGIPVVSNTVSEVATAASGMPMAHEAVRQLAALVERALYDPRPMDPRAGDFAFQLAGVVEAAVAAQLSRGERLRARFDGRSAAEILSAGR